MKHTHTLLALLALASVSACPSTAECEPLREDFDITQTVTAEQLEAIMADYPSAEQEAIRCQEACRVAYRHYSGWEAGHIENCSLTAPAVGDGQVSCTGRGWEYFCEE